MFESELLDLAERLNDQVRSSVARDVRDMCSREGLFLPGERALALVSGGQDSITLLELLATGLLGREGPSEVAVLHINHHLRGAESDEDEGLVRRHCARLEVALTVVDGPIDKSAGNVQEAARSVRRRAALEAAAAQKCDRIAVGHTLDDQAETVVYRMARYGGLAALRGMLPCDPPWVRPLLCVRRGDTLAFCRESGLEFAVDRGNAYPGYARTGVRESIMPAWEKALPGAAEGVARTAEVAAEAERLVAEVIEGAGLDLESHRLQVPRLRSLSTPLLRLVLHTWLDRLDGFKPTRKDVLAVEALLSSSGSSMLVLGHGWQVVREYDLLYLLKEAQQRSARSSAAQSGPGSVLLSSAAVPSEMVLPIPGCVDWNGRRVCAEEAARFCAPDPAREAYIDADIVTGEIRVRGMRAGDRVRPLGLGGTRKLQDVMVDFKVPVAARAGVPLVVHEGEILWVCGLLSAEQGRITAKTRRLIRLSVD